MRRLQTIRPLLCALAASAVLLFSAAPDSSADLPPRGTGAVWGVFSQARGGLTGMQVTRHLERRIDRRFGGLRNQTNFRTILPTEWDRAVVRTGRLDYHYINAWWIDADGDKHCFPYSRIAAGAYDSLLTKQARSVKRWGHLILLTFTHEPEASSPSQPSCGTAAEYRAAYDHVFGVFRRVGATNVRWVWTLIARTFRGDNGGPRRWEPAHYNIVGVDGYNKARAWRWPKRIFSAAERFAERRGKRLLIGEIGTTERPGAPEAKAEWIARAAQMVRGWPNAMGIMWSNTGGSRGDYWLDTSSSSLQAFRRAGLLPYFR